MFTNSSEDNKDSSSSESAHKDSDPEVYETDMESSRHESENEEEISNCEWGNDSESDSELLFHNVEKSIQTVNKKSGDKTFSKKETDQQKMIKALKRKKLKQMEQSTAKNKESGKKGIFSEQEDTVQKKNNQIAMWIKLYLQKTY